MGSSSYFNGAMAEVDGKIASLVKEKLATGRFAVYRDAFMAVAKERPDLFLQRERARVEGEYGMVSYDLVGGMLVNPRVVTNGGAKSVVSPLNLPVDNDNGPTTAIQAIAQEIAAKLVASDAEHDPIFRGGAALDLLERGLGHLVNCKMLDTGAPYHEALKLVASEHPQIDKLRTRLQRLGGGRLA